MYNPKISPKLEKSKGQIIVSYAGDLILGVTDIPEVISCLQCGKTFNTKEALCSHKYTHKSEKFACKKCSYESSYKSGLRDIQKLFMRVLNISVLNVIFKLEIKVTFLFIYKQNIMV